MSRPKPIRYSHEVWLVMRDDPAVPKALIRRMHSRDGSDVYLVIKWDIDPAKQVLMARAPSLETADELVRYDAKPQQSSVYTGPPNGRR
jgi:hypothetical protein